MENGKWKIIPFSLPKSLAAKITLPFVALFGTLLLALGWILAREIIAEVDARVEDEQRFVLEVAAFPGWPLSDESLRQIRDRARPPDAPKKPFSDSEFIVLQNGSRPLTTDHIDASSEGSFYAAFMTALAARPELEPRDETIRRHRVVLKDAEYMVLATARAPRGSTAPPRRFFLLHPYAEIELAKNRVVDRLKRLGLAAMALAATLGLALGHWIARPVRELAAAARHVTEAGLNEPHGKNLFGEKSVPLSPDADGGEIGELSRAFRSMLESLRRSQADVLQAERLAVTGKLAASVAHEIRNPLTSLRMTVQMLQSRQAPGDAQTDEAYRIVLSEIDRLALAVEELLTFARPRPPQKSPGDLNRLAADTLAFLEHQLSHAKVRARLEPDKNLPANIAFDPNKLKQLLVNLLLNAMQAIVRNGDIVVRTRWDAAGPRVVLEVEDSGPGIAPEVREKIFDLFVSTKPGGGLGLAIAKQIAEEHGGTITFDSAPGRTVFRVTLPA